MNSKFLQIDKAWIKKLVVRYLFSYEADALIKALRAVGVRSGDALMVHASWLPDNGFRGRPADIVNALKEVVGVHGLISMPSLTYHNQSSREFLEEGKPMDVRRTPSRMGLLSEVFRRGRGVVRSLSPTHPILAWGGRAEAFVAGHEKVTEPFGPETPFARLLEWEGKILTIDAPFSTITFCHFLEDRIADKLPFDLYDEALMSGTVVDYDGNRLEVPTRVLSKTANKLRRDSWLEKEMEQAGVLQRKRIGTTRLMLVDTGRMASVVDKMYAEGRSFFATPEESPQCYSGE